MGLTSVCVCRVLLSGLLSLVLILAEMYIKEFIDSVNILHVTSISYNHAAHPQQ